MIDRNYAISRRVQELHHAVVGLEQRLVQRYVTGCLARQQLHHDAVCVLERLDELALAVLQVPVLVQRRAHLAPAKMIYERNLRAAPLFRINSSPHRCCLCAAEQQIEDHLQRESIVCRVLSSLVHICKHLMCIVAPCNTIISVHRLLSPMIFTIYIQKAHPVLVGAEVVEGEEVAPVAVEAVLLVDQQHVAGVLVPVLLQQVDDRILVPQARVIRHVARQLVFQHLRIVWSRILMHQRSRVYCEYAMNRGQACDLSQG